MAASDEARIRELIGRWAEAVHRGDLDEVLADHAGDILMFDVPPSHGGVRGLRCGTAADHAADPGRRLRPTIGLRNEGGRWLVAHEHHSFPDRSRALPDRAAPDRAGARRAGPRRGVRRGRVPPVPRRPWGRARPRTA